MKYGFRLELSVKVVERKVCWSRSY